jgi:hypothetical protein
MVWRRPCLPANSEIADFGLKAFDLKPQRAAGRKNEFDKTGWRLGLPKSNIEKIENKTPVVMTKSKARDLENPPELKSRVAALAAGTFGISRDGLEPIEPRGDHRESLGARQIGHVADPNQGVLKICRDHRKIVSVEGDQWWEVRHRCLCRGSFSCNLSPPRRSGGAMAKRFPRIKDDRGNFKRRKPGPCKEMHETPSK